jgi:hypothetical protein
MTEEGLEDGETLARLSAGTRLPYPVVVSVTKLKNRSSATSRSTLRTEARSALDLAEEAVGKGERHAEQQLRREPSIVSRSTPSHPVGRPSALDDEVLDGSSMLGRVPLGLRRVPEP